jgi:hypothetical protein
VPVILIFAASGYPDGLGPARLDPASTANTKLAGRFNESIGPTVTPSVFLTVLRDPGQSSWQHPQLIRLPGTFAPARTPDGAGSPEPPLTSTYHHGNSSEESNP